MAMINRFIQLHFR